MGVKYFRSKSRCEKVLMQMKNECEKFWMEYLVRVKSEKPSSLKLEILRKKLGHTQWR